MNKNEEIKEMVKQKYSEIALQDSQANASSCCGSSCCSTEVYNIMNDEYDQLEGYNPDADLKLGCGLPTEYARIKRAIQWLIWAAVQEMIVLWPAMKQAKQAK
ncbi:MAG: hypothetical protein QM725_14230 [Lacibacter sp.]